MDPMFRCVTDPVRHTFNPKKPFVIAGRDIHLKKGMPVRVLWRSKTQKEKDVVESKTA